jgi:hypothetical protein
MLFFVAESVQDATAKFESLTREQAANLASAQERQNELVSQVPTACVAAMHAAALCFVFCVVVFCVLCFVFCVAAMHAAALCAAAAKGAGVGRVRLSVGRWASALPARPAAAAGAAAGEPEQRGRAQGGTPLRITDRWLLKRLTVKGGTSRTRAHTQAPLPCLPTASRAAVVLRAHVSRYCTRYYVSRYSRVTPYALRPPHNRTCWLRSVRLVRRARCCCASECRRSTRRWRRSSGYSWSLRSCRWGDCSSGYEEAKAFIRV